MQINFKSAENQSRWAWTEGLRTLGQHEIAVLIPWTEQDSRDILVTRLFQFVEDYLIEQPKRILPKQTMRYGWTTLRFVTDEHNLSGIGTDTLLIEERQNSFSEKNPLYVTGVTRTLALLQLQHEAIRRNRVAGNAIYPHHSQQALVCRRVTPETIRHFRPLKADRAWEPDIHDSGWFIGCCDQDHDHDNPDESAMIHLFHLVESSPGLFPYLAMPVGTMLVFEEHQAIVFRPDEDEGQVDPGSLLSSLP
jgi:hypothetical protein